ncbi:MAG: glutamate--tRNA ligase [Bdellovibrionota bacterium]
MSGNVTATLNPGFTEVRTRFAPSPTGYLHVGGARSALFNLLFAKHNNGKFILRIEDTDQARSTDESLRMMVQDMVWLGLNWDEGVDPVTLKDMGACAPYRQSQRLNIYKKVADELIVKGLAYYCFMTDEELDAERARVKAINQNAHVESPYETWTLDQAKAELATGKTAVVRFRTKHLRKDYLLQDLIRGEVRFPSDMVGDFVLLRSDGMPVYNFCCVVDDYSMKISHVLRAEEHLPNTLRQLMIFEAMAWPTPQFGHISLVLDDDRQKLSKRKGAVACDQFMKDGYLPEALNNFMALLGWSHPEGKEMFSMDEMIKLFSLDRVNASGAVFDRVKLKWMNSQYLRAQDNQTIWNQVKPFLVAAGIQLPKDAANTEWQMKSVETFKPKLEILADAVALYQSLDDSKFEISDESNEALGWEPTKNVLTVWKAQIENHANDTFSEADFVAIENAVKNGANVKGKNLFMPIRVAVIGKPHGTEVKLLVPLMSKQSLLDRVNKVLTKLG